MKQSDKMVRLLEEQLAFFKLQNQELSKQNQQLIQQIENLTEQISQLRKMMYGSRSEKSKYQAPDGQCSLFEDDPSFWAYGARHTNNSDNSLQFMKIHCVS